MKDLEAKREELRNSLKGDFMHDMPIREQIHLLTMKIEGTTPNDGSCDLDCDSCGA
tara:strand:+ start:438 stop:605 length:168 start_codon:yes stop_codon:yes gene_type:complete